MNHPLSFVKNVRGLRFWVLANQTLGISFELSIFDLDLHGTVPFSSLGEILHATKNLTFRFTFSGEHDNVFINGHKRRDEMNEYGAKKFTLYLHFEKKITHKELLNIDSTCESFLERVPIDALQRMGFSLRNLEIEEIPGFLLDTEKPISLAGSSLDFGDQYVNVLKLQEPKETISSDVMDLIVRELPCPFEIRIQLRTPEAAKIAMQFQLNVKRESRGGLFASTRRLFSNKDALEKLELEGTVYHAFEWHLVLIRRDLNDLKLATHQAYEVLAKHLGGIARSSVGQFPAIQSTELGEPFHSGSKFDFGGILESHQVLPYFFPIALRGAWRPIPENHSLGIHRLNHSVDFLSLFDSSYKSYSTVIVGDTGFGKSVFISQLIRSLHFDNKTKIIVIDVKGSNQRVVESLGGELFNINLTEPSGFNPFSTIKIDASEDTLNILKEFVASLCLEETETSLPEKLSAIIGIALKQYAKAFKKADLSEFLNFLPKDFERTPHLKRFTEGIESKVFASKKGEPKSKKLTYYYLERIETASNRALRKALVNAVLMEFYLLLRTKAPDEKVIFICDEAPFFIQDAFAIFAMLIKTMRSQKGALVLAVQYSENLVVQHNNVRDESLINQSATKILFNSDGDKDLFRSRFKLTESEYEILNQNRSRRGQYSQFLIKDSNGPRVARLYLTDREFWESGTDGVELAEILNLKAIFPEINDREAALILEQARARERLHLRTFKKEQEGEA